MYVSASYLATISLPSRLCKRVVIALARETQAETYRKDYTDPFASVAF
jgi:hypothetical protein